MTRPPGAFDVNSVVMQRLSGFGQLLRSRGLSVGTAEVMRAVAVLGTLDMRERDSLYWGLRLTMLRRVEQLETFDRSFSEYWESPALPERPPPSGPGTEQKGGGPAGGPAVDSPEHTTRQLSSAGSPAGAPGDPDADDADQPDAAETAAYSAVELIGNKDFRDYTPEDHLWLVETLARLRSGGPWRTSRRMRGHRLGAVDIRRTVRTSFRTEGHPVTLARRRRRRKQRRLTFVCDVSGSMRPYALAMLALAHVALRARRRVEVLAFATRLTRVTAELVDQEPSAAMSAAVDAVGDWSGGTRIGECFTELNRSCRPVLQGSVVVIASDGWDLGDPAQLSRETALLQRMAYRVVWVNPRLQDPEFEPLTRGMSAALPHVDHFLACHNFGSFVELLALLDRI